MRLVNLLLERLSSVFAKGASATASLLLLQLLAVAPPHLATLRAVIQQLLCSFSSLMLNWDRHVII